MGDAADLHVLGATTLDPPFGLFDWYLKPHLYSPDFPERGDAWADRIAARADFPIYFIDDETAIRVNGDETGRRLRRPVAVSPVVHGRNPGRGTGIDLEPETRTE